MMLNLTPKYLLSMFFCALVLPTSHAFANDNIVQKKIVTNGQIEIITSDGDDKDVMIFSLDDIADEGMLETKLQSLSPERRAQVKTLIENIKSKQMTWNGAIDYIHGSHDVDVEIVSDDAVEKQIEHIVITSTSISNDSDSSDTKENNNVFVFTSGDSATHIVELIKNGTFSAEQLTQIQQALDAKW